MFKLRRSTPMTGIETRIEASPDANYQRKRDFGEGYETTTASTVIYNGIYKGHTRIGSDTFVILHDCEHGTASASTVNKTPIGVRSKTTLIHLNRILSLDQEFELKNNR